MHGGSGHLRTGEDTGRPLRRHVQGRPGHRRSRPRWSRDWSSAPGSPSGDIDDVIFGQGYPTVRPPRSAGSRRWTRVSTSTVPGLQIDRRCGSGLQSVLYACMQVATGGSDLVLAGGAESMSQAEYYVPEHAVERRRCAHPARPSRAPSPQLGRTSLPGRGRHDRDRRERGTRVRHHPRGAGRVGRSLARAGRRRDRGGPVRRRDHPGHGRRSARATRSRSRATSTRARAPRPRASPGSSR